MAKFVVSSLLLSAVVVAEQQCCWSKWGDVNLDCGSYPTDGVGSLCNNDFSVSCITTKQCQNIKKQAPTPAPITGSYPYPCLSKKIVSEIQDKIDATINGLKVYEGQSNDPDNKNTATDRFDKADFIGGAVRLSFHDAGTWDKGSKSGGPDGCLHMADPDNGGLSEVVRDLIEPLYEPYKERLSRADFWVLAANTALTNAAASISRLVIPFNYGRFDCNKETWNVDAIGMGRLPHADKGWDHVKKVFVTRMGLSVTDIVALLGAHTLGRTDIDNSGFAGPWVEPSLAHVFDSEYYVSMIQQPWFKDTNTAGKPQWRQDGGIISADTPMMLNADIALLISNADSAECTDYITYEDGPGDYKIVSGQFGPNPKCIPSAETIKLAYDFQDQTLFFPAFASAFQKLQELGYHQGLGIRDLDDRGALLPPGTCFEGESVPADELPGADPPKAGNDSEADHGGNFLNDEVSGAAPLRELRLGSALVLAALSLA